MTLRPTYGSVGTSLAHSLASYRAVAAGFLLGAAVAAGCAEAPAGPQVVAAPPATLTVPHSAAALTIIEAMPASAIAQAHVLPAFETAAERLDLAKNDAASDYRNANPQYFAMTKPLPDDEFRPFGEWEEMDEVWTTYSGGMTGEKAVRRMMAEQTIAFVRDSKPQVEAYVIVPAEANATDFGKALDTYGATAAEKEHVHYVVMPNQTIWHIDYGPFPLLRKSDNRLAFADFVYYPNRHLDDAIPTRIAEDFYKDTTVFRMPFPFEGGNVQTDGKEKCMTSNRALSNTGYSAAKMRNLLRRYMGCKETFIVKDISDDGTGHIDMFFKWSAVDEVIFGKYENEIKLDYDGDGKEDTLPLPGSIAADYKTTFATNQKRMEDNSELMANATSALGTKYKVHRLSMMTRFKDQYGDLPRTFINSTFTNGVNVYPSYTDKSCRNPAGATCMVDADCTGKNEHCAAGKCTAGPVSEGCDEIVTCGGGQECVTDPLKVQLIANVQKQWEVAMPTWKHVGLRADTIALWSGAIHCITRTIPNAPHGKLMDDALCLGGECSCVDGGADNACDADSDCFGPSWVCNCQICKGTCSGTAKSCTDDADCSGTGPVVDGACVQDRNQACPGQSGSASECGDLPWEGVCDGKKLSFCAAGKKKDLSCTGCCGWSNGEGSNSCLAGAVCEDACIPECPAAGQKGCSAEGTHAWECKDVGGCLKREWKVCSLGCDGTGSCAVAGNKPACPGTGGEDAGQTDHDTTGGDDTATAPADDTAVATDGTTTTDSAGTGGTTTTPAAKSSGGCTASPSGSKQNLAGLFVMLAMGAFLSLRRRRA